MLLQSTALGKLEWLVDVGTVPQFFKELRRRSDHAKLAKVIAQCKRDRVAAGDERCIATTALGKFWVATETLDHRRALFLVKELHVLGKGQVLDRLTEVVDAIERQLERTAFGRANHQVVSHRRVASERFANHAVDRQHEHDQADTEGQRQRRQDA